MKHDKRWDVNLAKASDPVLREYALPTELEKMDAIVKAKGNMHEAARQTGLNNTRFSKALQQVSKRAAQHGYTQSFDATRFVDPGQHIIGKSTYTKDDEGNPVWIKTKADLESKGAAIKSFVSGLCEEITPAKPVKLKAGKRGSELMPAIFIGDAHLGMYAWGVETRHSDFDSDIAFKQLREAIDYLVDKAPAADQALLAEMGDFLHTDSSMNKTFKGTDVDVDTRYSRLLRIAGQAMQYAIKRMLEKFKKVVVVIVRDNHDPDSAAAVQLITEAYFHNEPRVDVLQTNSYFHYLTFGKWLFGFNHGDKIKPEKLVSVMARDQAQAWGNTTHRMWCLGHFHHQDVKEIDGCIVQKFGALPPPDAWHSSMGFSSGQVMQMIVFKKSGGRETTMLYELDRPAHEPDLRIA